MSADGDGPCKTEISSESCTVAKRLGHRIFFIPLESSVTNFIYHSLARTVGGPTPMCEKYISSLNQIRALALNLCSVQHSESCPVIPFLDPMISLTHD